MLGQCAAIHMAPDRDWAARCGTIVREAGVRFMPIIIFTRDSGTATALDFLKMGCDDIITFPATRAHLAGRLAHQIGRKLDFIQHGGYLRPVRPSLRDGEGTGEVAEHFTILRDPVHGVKIVAQGKRPVRQVLPNPAVLASTAAPLTPNPSPARGEGGS